MKEVAPMLGPLIGDVVGSIYEYANVTREDFDRR